MILAEVDSAQIYLQIKGITLDMSLKKLEALLLYLVEERDDIISKATTFGTGKCQELGIEIDKQRRKKKKLSLDECLADCNLTMQEELRRSMYECLDRFVQELQERSIVMKTIFDTFQVLQSKFLMREKVGERIRMREKMREENERDNERERRA